MFLYFTNSARGWIVPASEIRSLEAQGNYTRITLSAGPSVLVRRTLRACEAKLDANTFFRANRATIVNLAHVKQTLMFDPKRVAIVLSDGQEIVLSRKQSICLRRRFSI
jgi:two-component system, LytTR family, response regulator